MYQSGRMTYSLDTRIIRNYKADRIMMKYFGLLFCIHMETLILIVD